VCSLRKRKRSYGGSINRSAARAGIDLKRNMSSKGEVGLTCGGMFIDVRIMIYDDNCIQCVPQMVVNAQVTIGTYIVIIPSLQCYVQIYCNNSST
jgi:hypothetical protein